MPQQIAPFIEIKVIAVAIDDSKKRFPLHYVDVYRAVDGFVNIGMAYGRYITQTLRYLCDMNAVESNAGDFMVAAVYHLENILCGHKPAADTVNYADFHESTHLLVPFFGNKTHRYKIVGNDCHPKQYD
jgi:hypothetical protein